MSTIDPQTTLAQLINERPQVAPVLERLGLDYCCGGQQRLDHAAKEHGLDVADVLAKLEPWSAEPATAIWPQLGMAELTEHIVATHHAYLHEALPRLEALATKVAGVHGRNHPELVNVRRLLHEVRADLEPHLRKEEVVLFPMICEIDTATTAPEFAVGSVRNPISMMLTEHDRAGDLLAQLRRTTAEYAVPDDGCASYRALYAGLEELEQDTHLHVHKENNLLFPAALAAEAALAGGAG